MTRTSSEQVARIRRTGWRVCCLLVLILIAAGCGLASDEDTEQAAEGAESPGPTEEAEAATETEAATAGTGAAEPTDELAATPEGDPIVVGASLPLTGAFADTGEFVADGYQAWVDHMNDSGGLLGRPVELIIEDDGSDPGRATSLLERLITQEDIDLVLGGYPGSSAAAQMPIAEQHEMVYVSMGGHLRSFQQGFTYAFGAPPLMGEWWYRGFFDYLETLPEQERPQSAAMITVNNPVGAAVRDGVLADLERVGVELVMDELYDLPLASADTLVDQAKASGADLFIANSFFPDGVLALRAVQALDYQPKAILEGIGTLIPSWEDELGEGGNYVISGTALHPGLPFSDVTLVNSLASEVYGTDQAPIYFMFGATWAQVLQKGVEGAGTLDQTAIRDWLKSNEIETIGGPLTLDEQGLPEPYSYAIQVLDGVPELVWPEDVASGGIVYPIPWGE